MKMTTGNRSMEDISEPATSEQADCMWSSLALDEVGSSTSLLLVDDGKIDITTDVDVGDCTDTEEPSIGIVNSISDGSDDQGESCVVSADIENEDPDLQQAIAEMKRLDIILASKLHKEIEVKHQGKELREKLWQDLLRMPKSSKECSQEALNTRLFMALESPSGEEDPKEDADFEPVFGTQLSDQEFETDTRRKEQSGSNVCRTVGFSDVSQNDKEEEQSEGSDCGTSRAKKKQDFLKKNIEMASAGKDQVLMTQMEKQHLAELLSEIEEEEEEDAREADSEEGMWAVSVATGQGYSPEPFELARLNNITSSLHFLLPAEDFLSQQSLCVNYSLPQEEEALVADRDPSGTPPPGEGVLKHLREERKQELRLHDIQKQLVILNMGQERTNESPSLAEEQLLMLLEQCQLSQSWYQQMGSGHTSPLDPHGEDSVLKISRAISEDLVTEPLTPTSMGTRE